MRINPIKLSKQPFVVKARSSLNTSHMKLKENLFVSYDYAESRFYYNLELITDSLTNFVIVSFIAIYT